MSKCAFGEEDPRLEPGSEKTDINEHLAIRNKRLSLFRSGPDAYCSIITELHNQTNSLFQRYRAQSSRVLCLSQAEGGSKSRLMDDFAKMKIAMTCSLEENGIPPRDREMASWLESTLGDGDKTQVYTALYCFVKAIVDQMIGVVKAIPTVADTADLAGQIRQDIFNIPTRFTGLANSDIDDRTGNHKNFFAAARDRAEQEFETLMQDSERTNIFQRPRKRWPKLLQQASRMETLKTNVCRLWLDAEGKRSSDLSVVRLFLHIDGMSIGKDHGQGPFRALCHIMANLGIVPKALILTSTSTEIDVDFAAADRKALERFDGHCSRDGNSPNTPFIVVEKFVIEDQELEKVVRGAQKEEETGARLRSSE